TRFLWVKTSCMLMSGIAVMTGPPIIWFILTERRNVHTSNVFRSLPSHGIGNMILPAGIKVLEYFIFLPIPTENQRSSKSPLHPIQEHEIKFSNLILEIWKSGVEVHKAIFLPNMPSAK